MKFSIITIVLNDKDNIEKTILSILEQNIELEYIIIDGGSTDGTLDIIKKYEDKINILVSEKDNGIADAFNKGIKLTSGDIIGIVNSGDFLEKDSLSLVYQNFSSNVSIVYGDVQYWDGNKKDYVYSANYMYLNKFMSINHPAVFVRKSIYDNYGLFDEKFPIAMDYELMLRYFVKNVKFQYINKVLSNMSLGGVSDINWKKAYKESYEIRKKYLGFSLKLYLNYLFQVFKRYISNFLSNIGLEKVKKIYRNKFSSIKKVNI
jgi:glycosyltransferase involved in cell wall biosynthesis